jgi:hypothetical protein
VLTLLGMSQEIGGVLKCVLTLSVLSQCAGSGSVCSCCAVVSLLRVMCCVSGDASRLGRTLASRLKELLDRQQYEVIIQVRVLCSRQLVTANTICQRFFRFASPKSVQLAALARNQPRTTAPLLSLPQASAMGALLRASSCMCCVRMCWPSAVGVTSVANKVSMFRQHHHTNQTPPLTFQFITPAGICQRSHCCA